MVEQFIPWVFQPEGYRFESRGFWLHCSRPTEGDPRNENALGCDWTNGGNENETKE